MVYEFIKNNFFVLLTPEVPGLPTAFSLKFITLNL